MYEIAFANVICAVGASFVSLLPGRSYAA